MAHSLVKTKQFITKTRSDADSSVFQDAETITITKLGFNMAGFKKKLFNVLRTMDVRKTQKYSL